MYNILLVAVKRVRNLKEDYLCLFKATVQFLLVFNSYIKIICSLYISKELLVYLFYFRKMMEYFEAVYKVK